MWRYLLLLLFIVSLLYAAGCGGADSTTLGLGGRDSRGSIPLDSNSGVPLPSPAPEVPQPPAPPVF